jgi:hypothetical protein
VQKLLCISAKNVDEIDPCRSETIFDEILTFQPSKVIGISLSCINILFFTPLLYSIIWFERRIANNRLTFLIFTLLYWRLTLKNIFNEETFELIILKSLPCFVVLG